MTKYKTNSHVSVGEVRDMVPEEIGPTTRNGGATLGTGGMATRAG